MFLRPLTRSPWRLSISRSITLLSFYQYFVRHNPKPPSFPTTAKCPSPTCSCSETPELPSNLPIDHKTALNGTMAPYADQVLICTGKDDWPSRIEDENEGKNMVTEFKDLLGRRSLYFDPYHNVSILNSSLPSTPFPPPSSKPHNISAYLFPSFKYIPFLSVPNRGASNVHAAVKAYVLPTELHPNHGDPQLRHKAGLLRDEKYETELEGVSDVKDVVVFICGHGKRDQRCGVFGPVLRTEFEEVLGREGVKVERDAVDIKDPVRGEDKSVGADKDEEAGKTARVGLISHIGGHKFAGNVIIYIPPGMKTAGGKINPLAGCGIWYGRVEPKHVEGIVKETVLGGKVIEELFRGGIRQGGEILRL